MKMTIVDVCISEEQAQNVKIRRKDVEQWELVGESEHTSEITVYHNETMSNCVYNGTLLVFMWEKNI